MREYTSKHNGSPIGVRPTIKSPPDADTDDRDTTESPNGKHQRPSGPPRQSKKPAKRGRSERSAHRTRNEENDEQGEDDAEKRDEVTKDEYGFDGRTPEDLRDVVRILMCVPEALEATYDQYVVDAGLGLTPPCICVLLGAAKWMKLEKLSFTPEGFKERLRKALRWARKCALENGETDRANVAAQFAAEGGVLDRSHVEDLRHDEQWKLIKEMLTRRVTSSDVFEYLSGKRSFDERICELRTRLQQIEALGVPLSCSEIPPPDPADVFQPFPVDLLPEVAASIVRETAASKICDPSMVALPVLTVLGAAIGTARQIRIKSDWVEYAIIWTATIAESGTRKTPVFAVVSAPLHELQRLEHDEFQAKLQIFKTALREWEQSRKSHGPSEGDGTNGSGKPPREPAYNHILTTDTTVEAMTKMLSTSAKGIVLVKDELSDFVGNLNAYKRNSNDAAKYLEWYNGHGSKTDRKSQSPVYIERASVWITGTIQPAVFCKCFPDAYSENGFLARFLIAYAPRVTTGWSDETISQKTTDDWSRIVRALRRLRLASVCDEDDDVQTAVEPVAIDLTDDARARFKQFTEKNAQDIDSEPDAGLKAAWSKMVGYAAKFALIIHLVEHVPMTCEAEGSDNTAPAPETARIDTSTVERAIKLAEWFKHEARRIYRMRVDMSSGSDRERSELLGFIRRHGGKATAREVAANFRRLNKQSRLAKEELDGLEADGLGTWQKITASTGGRAADYFVLRK